MHRNKKNNPFVVFTNNFGLPLTNPTRALAARNFTAGEPLCLMMRAR